jgi:hypothetical protein
VIVFVFDESFEKCKQASGMVAVGARADERAGGRVRWEAVS